MWRPAYKQRCLSCKKNMVLIRHPRQRAICSDCQMKSFSTPVTDPKFIKLFDISQELYEQSSFLRDVRYQYGRFGNLSEKQVAAFQKVVKELTDKAKGIQPSADGQLTRPVRILRKEIDPFGRNCSLTLLRNPPQLQRHKPALTGEDAPKKAAKKTAIKRSKPASKKKPAKK